MKPPYNWGGDGHYYYFRMENVKVENGELLLMIQQIATDHFIIPVEYNQKATIIRLGIMN